MRTFNKQKTEIENSFNILCDYYNIRRIPIKWTHTQRGRFIGRRMGDMYWGVKVCLGIKCWRPLEETMLHEFSHYLTLMRYKKNCHHGKEFVHTLEEVCKEWYSDATKYNWTHEYKRIQAYALSNGLTKEKVGA